MRSEQGSLGKQIAGVTVYDTRNINTPNIFCEKLTGTSIEDIVREGKELHFLLANHNSFGVHLMLSGKFSIVNRNEVEKISSKIIPYQNNTLQGVDTVI